jgi:hypothetical protein
MPPCYSLRSHGDQRSAFRAKFAPRLSDNLAAAPQAKPAHDPGNNHIRPARAGAEDPYSREQHRRVADSIIARSNPHRAHIRVTCAETIKHQCHAAIGDQCRYADCAHDFGPWQRPVKGVPCRGSQHPQGKCNQGATLVVSQFEILML